MPTTATDLPIIAFSKNPINLVITSDDYIAVSGAEAISRLTINGGISAGTTMRLIWAKADITFTAAAIPDSSGTQFPTGTGDETHVLAIMADLAQNFYVNRDFELAYALFGGLPTIFMVARINGVNFNLSPFASAHITLSNDTEGVNLEYQPYFAHYLDVWLKIAGVFTNIYSGNLQLDFPISGATTKDLSEILNDYLYKGSDKPDLDTTTWQACANSLMEYYVKYGPYYGDLPTIKKLTTMPSAFVNLGGLDIATAFDKTLLDYLRPAAADPDVLCLKQGSLVNAIQADQPEFLYWINLTGADVDIKIRLEIFYVGGGSLLVSHALSTATAYQKYYINIGYLAIAGYLPVDKQCAYYTIRVMSQSGLYLSQLYTYVLDNYHEWPRYFIYRNSLGGFQTLYTWGKSQPETARTKEDVKKQVTYSQAATSGAFAETNIRIQRKYTVNTGYTSKRNVLLLDDLLASDEKYRVYNGKLIPIGISTDSIKYTQDGDNLNSASFEYYPLYDQVVFTDDLTLPNNPNDTANVHSDFNFLTNKESKYLITPDLKKIIV